MSTNNPIGSADPIDFYTNSQNLDLAMNGTDLLWADRFGIQRVSWAGVTKKFDDSISKLVLGREALRRTYAEAGFNLVEGSFESGGTVTNINDVLLYEADGHAYNWNNIFPDGGKNIPEGSTPNTTGGVGVITWIDKSQTSLSQCVLYVRHYHPIWNGIVDNTEAIRQVHKLANLFNITVSYAGITKYAIDADAKIEICTETDFCGAEANILNGMVGIPSYSGFKKTFIINDPRTPVVSSTGTFSGSLGRGSRTPTKGLFNGPGYAVIETGYKIPDRAGTGTVNYKQSFNVVREGQCTLPLSWDLSPHVDSLGVKYRKSLDLLVISGVHLREGGYNNLQFLSIERCNVDINGLTLSHDNNPSLNNINRIIYGYYTSDIRINTLKGTGQPVTETVGSYVIQFDYGADIYIDNANSTWFGWSSTGNNHVNGLYFSNCSITRVDAHEGGHNIFVDSCRLYDRGVGYGWGGGVISITNTIAIDCFNGVVETRDDYGGNFFGSIIIDNVQYEYPLTASITVADIKAGASIDTYLPETITVSKISWIGAGIGSKKRVLVNVYKAPGKGGSVYAPSEIKIDGLSSSMPFYFGGNFDYGNMITRTGIYRYDLIINNVSSDTTPDKGNGINITPGGTCLVYFVAINHKFLLLEAPLSNCLRNVEIFNSSISGLHTQSGNSYAPMTIISNCLLLYPAAGFTGPVPIGGKGFGNDRFTRMIGCTIGYVNFDLSGIDAVNSTIFLNGSGTPPSLPTGFTIDDFFIGKKTTRFL